MTVDSTRRPFQTCAEANRGADALSAQDGPADAKTASGPVVPAGAASVVVGSTGDGQGRIRAGANMEAEQPGDGLSQRIQCHGAIPQAEASRPPTSQRRTLYWGGRGRASVYPNDGAIGASIGGQQGSRAIAAGHPLTGQASRENHSVPADAPDIPTAPDGLCADAELLWELWQSVVLIHQEVWDALAWNSRQMKSDVYSKHELVDLGFLCRELENLLDDWRKDCKARKELAGKLIARAVLQAADGVNDLQASTVVHGILASASPDVSMIAEIPKPGTPEFVEFCNHFGISKECSEDPLFPFAIHWKRAMECLELRQTEGKPIPPGFGKQFPHFWSKFVRKKRKE